jgi:hypothetical protein
VATEVKEDPRVVVGSIAVDPAHSGPCGLSVGRWGGKGFEVVHSTALQVRSMRLFRWLGEAITACVRPGERLLFAAEADAFGGHAVARKLGIAVGIVEGTAVDLNAVAPESRIDVFTRQWRRVLGTKRLAACATHKTKAARRRALKAAAVDWALEKFGLELEPDAAEALAINEWLRRKHAGLQKEAA